MPIKIDEHAARGDGSLTRYIEGVARQQRITFPAQTSEIAMLMVFFEAGSDRPHTPEDDQTLLILTGECMVATETEKYVLTDARHRSRHWPPPQRSGRRSSLLKKTSYVYHLVGDPGYLISIDNIPCKKILAEQSRPPTLSRIPILKCHPLDNCIAI